MIQEYIDKWFVHKEELRAWFRNRKQSEYDDYKAILEAIVEVVINRHSWESEKLDMGRVTIVDDGNYSGTLIFLVPKNSYCPGIHDYVLTYIDYGSCPVCDTLLGIQDYDMGFPTENQISRYMCLALHLIENMRVWDD